VSHRVDAEARPIAWQQTFVCIVDGRRSYQMEKNGERLFFLLERDATVSCMSHCRVRTRLVAVFSSFLDRAHEIVTMSNSPNNAHQSLSGRENPTGISSSTPVKRRNSRESPMAFYEIPSWVPNVPSKIINDAKLSLKEIPTSRPYTPRDDSRYSLSKLRHEPASFR
jgi:hypothetical protein